LMGAAIAGFHYTAMAAVSFTKSPVVVGGLSQATEISLVGRVAIFIGTLTILGFTVLTSLVDRRFSAQATVVQHLLHHNELILHSTSEGICGVDLEGRVTFMNPPGARMLGYEMKEFLGRPLRHFVHHSQPDGSPYPQETSALYSALVSGHVHQETIETFWRKDGTPFPVEYTSNPIEEEGRFIGAVLTFKDITTRKESERQLVLASQELDEKNKELAQAYEKALQANRRTKVFLASMSHELRTPLNSIIGFTGIMLQGMVGDINEEQRTQLTMVKNSARHLLDLINDVLDVSKIEAGMVNLSLSRVALDDVVNQVTETMAPLAQEKGLEFHTDVPDGVTLYTDRRRLIQILMNFVSNAVKFTAHGTVSMTAQEVKDGQVEIRVVDTGIGIKPEDMDRLFHPFQQVDMSLIKTHEGTGLGLYLCQKLAGLLGGEITAKSHYGKGSEFVVVLPVKHEEVVKT
ncbi:MAG: ATP-binding protein, partial [Nitrospirota bacterium]|nr:ATP-binding protein [Nitrospirota bacterium]